MPILRAEPALFPECLFKEGPALNQMGRAWWVLHVKPRQEKSLSRQLCDKRLPFYLPLVSRRSAPRGRVFTSHIPLFPGYLFLLADADERLHAQATGRVVQALPVPDQVRLWSDLRQVHRLILTGAPLTPEERLAPGMVVEVTTGALAGLRGKILRAASVRRFVVEIDFLQRGASVLLDDFALTEVKSA